MTILLSALGLGAAAFCVWLGVRIINRRQRLTKKTAVGLAVIMAYAFLWGPACCIWHRTPAPDWLKISLDVIWFPMDWLHWHIPDPTNSPLHWYWCLWTGYW